MFIYIGSDHAGYELKNQLINHYNQNNSNYFIDCGCYNTESVDYPDIAYIVKDKVIQDNSSNINSIGILICGTGIGMSISANKFSHIRAALINDIYTAQMSKLHNNANIICLGARILDFETSVLLINKFLDTEFEGGRHEERLKKIEYNIFKI